MNYFNTLVKFLCIISLLYLLLYSFRKTSSIREGYFPANAKLAAISASRQQISILPPHKKMIELQDIDMFNETFKDDTFYHKYEEYVSDKDTGLQIQPYDLWKGTKLNNIKNIYEQYEFYKSIVATYADNATIKQEVKNMYSRYPIKKGHYEDVIKKLSDLKYTDIHILNNYIFATNKSIKEKYRYDIFSHIEHESNILLNKLDKSKDLFKMIFENETADVLISNENQEMINENQYKYARDTFVLLGYLSIAHAKINKGEMERLESQAQAQAQPTELVDISYSRIAPPTLEAVDDPKLRNDMVRLWILYKLMLQLKKNLYDIIFKDFDKEQKYVRNFISMIHRLFADVDNSKLVYMEISDADKCKMVTDELFNETNGDILQNFIKSSDPDDDNVTKVKELLKPLLAANIERIPKSDEKNQDEKYPEVQERKNKLTELYKGTLQMGIVTFLVEFGNRMLKLHKDTAVGDARSLMRTARSSFELNESLDLGDYYN